MREGKKRGTTVMRTEEKLGKKLLGRRLLEGGAITGSCGAGVGG